MAKSSQEVVHEGWLTKSPPTKRIWRAKWRRRWFSLKHSGEIPNQFILTYYADRNCRKYKGSINLDDCEQVDLGLKLDERKLKFDHVFDIKTPTRTYYLAADSEVEMKSWVDCICKICGLKSASDEEDIRISDHNDDTVFCEEERDDLEKDDAPPISPVSTSPYIPISECFTGRTPISNTEDLQAWLQQNFKNYCYKPELQTINQTYGISQRNYLNNYVNDTQDPRFYDSPRLLSPPHKKDDNNVGGKKDANNISPLQSPTDSESVFTDDDIGDLDVIVTQKFTKGAAEKVNEMPTLLPPRPPKTVNTSNYMNLNNNNEDKVSLSGGGEAQKIVSDEMYDFPRSHQVEPESLRNTLQRRHFYNNAAPGKLEGQVFRYDNSPKPSTSTTQVFRYEPEDLQDEPASPLSQTSSTTGYSNLPSPLLADTQLMPPPIVNRELKPKRKLSDSVSINLEPSSPRGAPSVDRKLKPTTPLQDSHARRSFIEDGGRKKVSPQMSQTRKTLSVDEETSRRSKRNLSYNTQRLRAAPSPSLGRSHESLLSQNPREEIYHMQMQYLDLDLERVCPTTPNAISKVSSANTVYKKVDFEKTEAFNLTRNNLEKERKEPVPVTTTTFLKK